MPPDRTAFDGMPDFSARQQSKPKLLINNGNLPATARALRDLFVECGDLFERDTPVQVVRSGSDAGIRAVPLTISSVIMKAHDLCQPIVISRNEEEKPVTLPERVVRMYLDMFGEWNLPPLVGISTAPLLTPNGAIRDTVGYDRATGLWCCKVPALDIPERVRRDEAVAALRTIREAFRTFPFADALRLRDPFLRAEVVDIDQPPDQDESAFLAGLLTAICRPSLWLAPGFLAVAPQVSGAGVGKGLLVRAICLIAFGSHPRAFTAGHDRQELDKRFVAELIEATPALFLDNVNAAVLRSETLASVLTERPARVRLLGETRMVALNSTGFIAITGNGLRVSEDLARRFLLCELDARCEDPETRDFTPGFLEGIERRRAELLIAALTIWRYGRQQADELRKGRPFGSFEGWCAWVRDPLLALGCRDPVERVELVKAQDPQRQQVTELYRVWSDCHGETAVKAAELAEPVWKVIDPHGRGRQFVVTRLGSLVGTRAAGFVLTRQNAAGAWGAATYALRRASDGEDRMGHREHRDHRTPMPPMVPMPDEIEAAEWTL